MAESIQDIEELPTVGVENVKQVYLCLLCKNNYPTQDEAVVCSKSHDKVSEEYMYTHGQEHPVAILLVKLHKDVKVWEAVYDLSSFRSFQE